MTPKERRTMDADLATLFSVKAFLVLKTMEDWQSVGFFHPSVRTETNTHPLSKAGSAALTRMTKTIQKLPELGECTSGEIAQQVHESYEGWLKQRLVPDSGEFVEECSAKLLATVKERSHLINLAGLELTDIERIELGPVTICKPDMELLKDVKFGGAIRRDLIETKFMKELWLIGKSFGSPELGFKRFEHQSALTIGILAVCGSILYEGAVWQSHLRTGLSPYTQVTPFSVFRWDADGDNPTISHAWGSDKLLPLKAELIEYLRRECFLDQMAGLVAAKSKTQLQESIERALYWFADAHGDRNTTMRFIKLWSCAECFFAITGEDVTESNARGIAAILTFAGYGVGKVEDYAKLKRRLKQLYDLRSRAVHRAEFDGIELLDLQDLSRWVAWIIVSMTALAERGYRDLASIKMQVDRLDASM